VAIQSYDKEVGDQLTVNSKSVLGLYAAGVPLAVFLRQLTKTGQEFYKAHEVTWQETFTNSQVWKDAFSSLGTLKTYELIWPWLLFVVAASAVAWWVMYKMGDWMVRPNASGANPKLADGGEALADVDAVPAASFIAPLETFANPMEPEETSEEALGDGLALTAQAEKECYDKFELGQDETTVIYFEQSAEYVDSFMQVTTEAGEVSETYLAFTFPPSDGDDWLSYIATIGSPESTPELLSLEEITVNGESTALDPKEIDWLSEHFVAVCQQATTRDGERPPQAAPTTVY
jgi:hypothetical protein